MGSWPFRITGGDFEENCRYSEEVGGSCWYLRAAGERERRLLKRVPSFSSTNGRVDYVSENLCSDDLRVRLETKLEDVLSFIQ